MIFHIPALLTTHDYLLYLCYFDIFNVRSDTNLCFNIFFSISKDSLFLELLKLPLRQSAICKILNVKRNIIYIRKPTSEFHNNLKNTTRVSRQLILVMNIYKFRRFDGRVGVFVRQLVGTKLKEN